MGVVYLTASRLVFALWVGLPALHCTWNAHALLHLNPKKRNAKLAALRSYTKDIDIFTLQETHGSEEEMKDAFFWFAKDFYMFFSPSPDRNVWGCCGRRAWLCWGVAGGRRRLAAPGFMADADGRTDGPGRQAFSRARAR